MISTLNFNIKNKLLLVALSTAALSLSACQTTSTMTERQETDLSKIDAILERAANDAAMKGKVKESLELLDNMYKRNPTNSAIAMRYARALRQHGDTYKASLVLNGFVNTDNPKPMILTEYAALQAAQGNYMAAEDHARRSILDDAEQPRAYHILGIALDAQGHHKEAEVAFRHALEGWTGDPVPVLNNLGLNLAAQGHLDQAAETLRKASAAAPDREEIERNLRIVSALQNNSGVYGSYFEHNVAPKPVKKPSAKEDAPIKAGEVKAQPVTEVKKETTSE
jgi:Flp pilus assembly protein TadD